VVDCAAHLYRPNDARVYEELDRGRCIALRMPFGTSVTVVRSHAEVRYSAAGARPSARYATAVELLHGYACDCSDRCLVWLVRHLHTCVSNAGFSRREHQE